jgi:hypothetical protein
MKINQFPKDKVVFTTKYVVNENSPIVYVTCDEDGDLHAVGIEDSDVEDAMIISLDEILTIDKSLLNLPDLEINTTYERASVNKEWVLIERT